MPDVPNIQARPATRTRAGHDDRIWSSTQPDDALVEAVAQFIAAAAVRRLTERAAPPVATDPTKRETRRRPGQRMTARHATCDEHKE